MPGLGTDLAGPSGTTQEIATSTPECIPLHLPSSLAPDHRVLICMADIPAIEDQLRFAQASEALTMLRCQLMKRTYANQYKTQNVSLQHHYTRFRVLQEQVESKIKVACRRYRMARAALFSLRGPGKWEDAFQELRPNDVRGISEKVLADEEQEETRKACHMAGLDDKHVRDTGHYPGFGIAAYTAENATAERHRLVSWSSHWEAVRQRARLVLQNHLSGNEEGGEMGALEIEIEDEDDEAPIFDSDDT
ncbi:hypothetical protein L208DRAFT_1381692 [Tricholoma matsutake]|nr:hypothetical protein L208DRAFT_1381692 [Tricholoma matsutake 945]